MGIDWLRGIAAFGVVATHMPFSPQAQIGMTENAEALLIHWRFHVPFFLVAVFVFSSRGNLGWCTSVKRRAVRLLVPLAFWSLVYVGLRALKLSLLGGSLNTGVHFTDMVPLIFFGSGSVQLYFLPMVFIGLVVALGLEPLLKKSTTPVLLALLVVGLGVRHLLVVTGNSFNMTTNFGFEAATQSQQTWWMRIVCGEMAWVIALLPFILIAQLIRRDGLAWGKQRAKAWLPITFFAAAAISTWLGRPYLGEPIHSVIVGALAFLLGSSVSGWMRSSRLSDAIGRWSFPVYLMHVVPVQLLQIFAQKTKLIGVLDTTALLLLSGIAFTLCLFACAAIERTKSQWARLVVGL